MAKPRTLGLALISMILAPPAYAADDLKPGTDVAPLLEQMKELFKSDGGTSKGPPKPAMDNKSRRLLAEQRFKEAQSATHSKDWPRAAQSAQEALNHYLVLSFSTYGAQAESDKQMMKHCSTLITNAAYHMKGGPFQNLK